MTRSLLLLTLASALSFAGFGLHSWDGPLMRLDQLTGNSNWVFGREDWPAGQWCITQASSHTAWGDDRLFISAGHIPVQLAGTQCWQIAVPWHLEAVTRDLVNSPSTGDQFAVSNEKLVSDLETWIVGLEDMAHGDGDYNDVVVLVQRISATAAQQARYSRRLVEVYLVKESLARYGKGARTA